MIRNHFEINDSVDFTKRLDSHVHVEFFWITIVTIYAAFIDGGLVKNNVLIKNK